MKPDIEVGRLFQKASGKEKGTTPVQLDHQKKPGLEQFNDCCSLVKTLGYSCDLAHGLCTNE